MEPVTIDRVREQPRAQTTTSVDFECTESTSDTDSMNYRSMVETASIEIKNVIDALDPNEDTMVIVTADNGTPASLEIDPWDASKVKGSVGQGGVRVPVIFWGDGVADQEFTDHSVNLVDLYATILGFAGKSSLIPNGVDAVSLKDLVEGTSSTAPRELNYSETFYPNFEPGTGFGPCSGQQAVQEDPGEYASATYKYVRTFDSAEEALYDLDTDPTESDNLIDDPPHASRLADLEDHIDVTLDSDLASLCDKKDTGESCTADSQCCSNKCSTATLECVCEM